MPLMLVSVKDHNAHVFCLQYFAFLVRPETIVFGVDSCFSADDFYLFISMQDVWDVLADRHEILHGDQYQNEFYNAGPKFWGLSPKQF